MHRLILPLLLTACGTPVSASCLAYTDAIAVCLDEADAAGMDVDVDTTDAEGFCEAFASTTDTQWDCEATAIGSADCASVTGLAEMEAAREACQ